MRDPERTRERILAAALQEFAAKGLSGARVDAIAEQAGVNKRMLYHYFGHKDDLFRAVMQRTNDRRMQLAKQAPADPTDNLPYFYQAFCSDVDYIRLVEWEALEFSDGAVIGEPERRASLAGGVARLRRAQAQGALGPDLDPELAFLAALALTSFPVAFPQFVRLITGLSPTDPRFRRRWTAFLGQMAWHMATAAAPSPADPAGTGVATSAEAPPARP